MGFEVTVLFEGKYLKPVHFRDKVTIKRTDRQSGVYCICYCT